MVNHTLGAPERTAIGIACGGAALTLALTLLQKSPISVFFTLVAIAIFATAALWQVARSGRSRCLIGILVVVSILFWGYVIWPRPPMLIPEPARWDPAFGHFKVGILVQAKILKGVALIFDRFVKIPCDPSSVCDLGVERRLGWLNGSHSWDLTEVDGQKEFLLFTIVKENNRQRLFAFYEGYDSPEPPLREFRGLNDISPGTYEVHLVLRSDSESVRRTVCVHWSGDASSLKIDGQACNLD